MKNSERFFTWKKSPSELGRYELFSPVGKLAATAWDNGTWHTWDRRGTGGENSKQRRLFSALEEAFRATIVQGWHGWGRLKLDDALVDIWNASVSKRYKKCPSCWRETDEAI